MFVEGGSRTQDTIHVKMGVNTISGFSGHSDFKQLMAYIRNLDPRPRKVIVVHGEQSKCLEFASNIYQTYRIETTAPKVLEAIRLK